MDQQAARVLKDQALLENCLGGDQAAWRAFVTRLTPIVRFAVSSTLSRYYGTMYVSVDDLVQDVYLRLMKKDCRLLRQFDPARATLPTWAAIVARSVTLDHLRSRRRIGPFRGNPAAEVPETAGTRDIEASDMLEYVKGRLSAEEWNTLNLLMVEGLAPEAVGKQLGLSTKTVYNRKLRILKKLRQLVRDAAP